MPDRITLDQFELEVGFIAAVEGRPVRERELHCLFMAVQSFSRDTVQGALAFYLMDADRPQPVTPGYLKSIAQGYELFTAATGPDDDDTEAACA